MTGSDEGGGAGASSLDPPNADAQRSAGIDAFELLNLSVCMVDQPRVIQGLREPVEQQAQGERGQQSHGLPCPRYGLRRRFFGLVRWDLRPLTGLYRLGVPTGAVLAISFRST